MSDVPVDIGDILQFTTGLREVPPLGFDPTPKVTFLHESDSVFGSNRTLTFFAQANTCVNTLRLPVHLRGQVRFKHFKAMLNVAFLNNQGFAPEQLVHEEVDSEDSDLLDV